MTKKTLSIISVFSVIVAVLCSVFSATIWHLSTQQNKTIVTISDHAVNHYNQSFMDDTFSRVPQFLSYIKDKYSIDDIGFVVYWPQGFNLHAKILTYLGNSNIINKDAVKYSVSTAGMHMELNRMIDYKDQFVSSDYENPLLTRKVKVYKVYPVFSRSGVFFGAIFIIAEKMILFGGEQNDDSHLLSTDVRFYAHIIGSAVTNIDELKKRYGE